MSSKAVATALAAVGIALGVPASAGALSFARTDYPVASLTSPVVRSANPGSGPGAAVALVDLNNDGRLDIVVADYGTGRVDVLLNQGNGALAAAPGSPFAACDSDLEAHDIVAGQLNPQTDQNADVAVICDTGAGGIVRLLGDGTGSLGAPQTFLTGAGAGGVGSPLKLAHVSASPGGDYLYGSGTGTSCFVAVESAPGATPICDSTPSSSNLTPVHWYDGPCFGGDQWLYISTLTTFAAADLDPRIGPGGIPGPNSCTGPFQSSTDRSSGIAPTNNATAMAAADLNRDGEPDVITADTGGGIHVIGWQGTSASFDLGIPATEQPSTFTSAGPALSLGIADFTRDGCPDIAASEAVPTAVPYPADNVVAIHAGHCTTTQFDAAQTFAVAGGPDGYTQYPKMAVGDVNGDGTPDIVTAAGYGASAAVTVLLNATPVAAGGGGGGSTGGGGAGGTNSGGGSAGAAVVGTETLSPKAFRAAPSGLSAIAAKRGYGSTVTYSLNENATVRFSVVKPQRGRRARGGRCVTPTKTNRKARTCTRLVAIPGRFTRAGNAGANRFRFTGRLAGRKLRPGKYRLVATPTASGHVGRPASASFQIIK
jgi:hypothetical protein